MNVLLDSHEYEVAAGAHVTASFVLVNDALIDRSFALDATPDAALRGSRIELPHHVSVRPGENLRVECRLVMAAGKPAPGTYPIRIDVRDEITGVVHSAHFALIAKERPCVAFPKPPAFTLNPDGTVTATLSLLNCGGFDVSVSLDFRYKGEWRFALEDPELTLDASRGPVDIEVTLTPPSGASPHAGADITLEASVHDHKVAETSGRIRRPTSGSLRRRARWTAAIVGVAMFVVGSSAIVVLNRDGDLGLERSPRPSVSEGDVAAVAPSGPDLGLTYSFAGRQFSVTVVNGGPQATGVNVTLWPADATFRPVGPDTDIERTGGTVMWDVGDLTHGAAVTRTFVVVPPGDGSWSVSAAVDGDQNDPNPANDTISYEVVPEVVSEAPVSPSTEITTTTRSPEIIP